MAVNRFRNLNSEEGFTLVELLVVSALLALVLGLVVGIHLFVVRSASVAQKYSSVQQSVQLAMTSINNRLKFASDLVIASEEENYAELDHRIFVEPDNGSDVDTIKYHNRLTDRVITLTTDNKVQMEVEFAKRSSTLISICIQGEINGEHEYELETEFYVYGGLIQGEVGDTGTQVFFNLDD